MSATRHQRSRSGDSFRRRAPVKRAYDRILIVCEGEKTEPLYLEEIRIEFRLPTANVVIVPGGRRTEPLQIVQRAHERFLETRSFEHVYAVFDRDQHNTYAEAIRASAALDGHLQNEERRQVRFTAVPNVPLFEVWLLLHFEAVETFGHRQDIIDRLGRHITGYNKGMTGSYALTAANLDQATRRAQRLRNRFTAETGEDPWTNMDEVVGRLTGLRAQDVYRETPAPEAKRKK